MLMNLNQLFSHWDQIHADTLATLEKFEEAELSHLAYEGGMPVGRIALHIADAEEGWFRLAITKERSEWPSDYTFENYPTKDAIKTLLSEVHVKTMAYLETLTVDDLATAIEAPWGKFSIGFIIWHVLEHEIHHRGELSLILGVLGREGLDV
jgi:uncharacterized damage-inducible protein DinB